MTWNSLDPKRMANDLYDLLGVKKSASDSDITKAYRKLARQHHPDRNPGDKAAEAKFKEIQSAFDVLGDATKRAEYDQFGSTGGPGSGGPGGFHFRGSPGGQGFAAGDAQRIFEQFFGGGGAGSNPFGGMGGSGPGRRRQAEPPPPQESEITIPFEKAVQGGPLDLNIAGQSVSVKIPAGMEDGKALRLAGQAPGGGDLLLRIRVGPHEHYAVEDGQLIVAVPISLPEAVLGGPVDVPLPDGSQVSIKVPPGTSSGRKLRLRGKGIKGGDAYVRFQVMVPAEPSDKAKELIQEFAKHHADNPRTSPFWKQ